MEENKNAECSSCTAESGEKKTNEVILLHSLKESKPPAKSSISLEDCPGDYINMTKAFIKLSEVISCFNGHVSYATVSQGCDPSINIDCMINGRAYSILFTKAEF